MIEHNIKLCPQGHNKNVVGTTQKGACKQCARESSLRCYHALDALGKKKCVDQATQWGRNNPEKRKQITARNRATPESHHSQYRSLAKRRGISFNLTFEQFMTFWQKDCVCGCKIKTIGLDRIDSNKGYDLSNVRSMCFFHNGLKRHYTDQDVITLAQVLIKINMK